MQTDRPLTLPSDARTLWVHWGRSGGGPRFLAELIGGDLAVGDSTKTFLSYNSDAEIAETLRSFGVESFQVRTYRSKMGVILGIPRLLRNSLKLRKWMKDKNIERVVCVMENVYQSLVLPIITPGDIEYVACIHDGTAHPGEKNLVQTIGRKNELRRARRVVTFSSAVTNIIEKQVTIPISTGSHPPFDLKHAASRPRQLPTERIPVVGLFGRLQKYKGIDTALKAAAILRARGVPDFELRITGTGPEEYLKGTPLGKEAVWDSRWIPENQIASIIQSTDIMLLPYSEASQSGPVTLAQSHAVPCVVTPVGAIPEQVEGFGIVSDDCSPSAVADALEDILTDPDLYQSLSKAALDRLNRQPTWSDLARLIRTAPGAGGAVYVSRKNRGFLSGIKWLGQRLFSIVNMCVPLVSAKLKSDRTKIILPAAHGSFGDEAMGTVAVQMYPRADLVVPGDPSPWVELVPESVKVQSLSDITVGPGYTPTRRTLTSLHGAGIVVVGADTLAGDYELSILATRVRLLNAAVQEGKRAELVNFSLPDHIDPDALRLLRKLDHRVQLEARDAVSARRAKVVFGREVACSADIAAKLQPAGKPLSGNPVVFVPNAHIGDMYSVSRVEIVDLWKNIALSLGMPVKVLVHDIREEVGDIELAEIIAEKVRGSGIDADVIVPHSAAEAKGLLSGARVCVSSRMHACVAALSSGVPTVGIGYVGKFSGQFSWFGELGLTVDFRKDLTAEDVCTLVHRVLSK